MVAVRDIGHDLPYVESGSLYIKGEQDTLSGKISPYYKVGIVRGDKDVSDRDKALRTGNPRTITAVFDLQTYFAQKLETRLHNQFAYARVSSGEWFSAERCPIDQMIATAAALNDKLNEYAAALSWLETLSKEPSGAVALTPTPEILELAARYSDLAGRISVLNSARKQVTSLLNSAADADAQLFEAMFKASVSNDRTTFSVELVKKNYPELYESFKNLKKVSISSKIVVTPSERNQDEHLDEVGLPSMESFNGLAGDPLALHQLYLAIWAQLEISHWDQWVIEARIHYEAMQHKGIEGVLEWDEKVSLAFDREAFLQKHPELKDECSKTTPGKLSYSVAEWAAYPL